MLKLNRKGYLTIEIILASAIAFVIAFFLIDITMKLVDKTDNYYVDTVFMTDKALVTKNIKELIQNDINDYGIITNVECNNDNKYCNITFGDGTINTLVIDKDKKQITYGDYTKKFDTKLSGDIRIGVSTSTDKKYIVFYMKFTNIFEGNNYDIIIPILNENNVSNEDDNTCISNGNSHTVTVYIDGDRRDPVFVKNCDSFSQTYMLQAPGSTISCTNEQEGTLEYSTGFKYIVNINNVTSDTECYIEY